MAIPADFVEVLAVFDSDWVLQAWRARSEVKLIQPMRPQIEIESKEVKIENRPPCQIEIEPAYESQEITIELNGVKKALNSMKIDREPQISEYDLKVWIGEIIDVPGRKHMFIYAIRDTFVEPMSEDETFLKFRIALRLQELAGAETVTNTGDIVSDKLAAFTEDMVKRMIKCEKKHNIPNVEFNHEAKRSVAMLLAHGKWNVEEQHYERGELFWQFILSAGKSVLSTHPGMYVDMLELHFIMSAASLQTHTCLDDAQELYEQQKGDKADADAQIPAAFHDMFARGLVLNNRFDEAMLHCQLSREKTEKTEAYKAGEVWPEMAVLTQAWCLVGLDRESEAEDMLVDMLAWRESKYGKDDIEDTKTGAINQILGVIRQSQGIHEKSIEYFQKALDLDAQKKGEASWRVQAIRIRLAEYYTRLAPTHEDPGGEYERARILFDLAIENLSDSPFREAEVARANFRKGEFLRKIGEPDEALECFLEAERMYDELEPDKPFLTGTLTAKDFDEIVPVICR